MPQLDRTNLASITVFVGERDYHLRQQLRELFMAEGIKNVSTHSDVSSLRSLMADVPPDLLVLSDNFDPDVFDLIRQIRFNQLGHNPFVIITMLIGPRGGANAAKAIQAGADDVVIKPLDSQKIHERLHLIAYYRQPFVATSDYVGPDRKGDKPMQPGATRVHVLNTIREKADGKTFELGELQEAVKASQNKVVEAQLASQSMKMGALCDLILDAYNNEEVTEDVLDNLTLLTGILREAGSMARQLHDKSLQELCKSLAENVSAMERHYDELSEADLGLIQKLSQAFRMAIDSAAQKQVPVGTEEEEMFSGHEP